MLNQSLFDPKCSELDSIWCGLFVWAEYGQGSVCQVQMSRADIMTPASHHSRHTNRNSGWQSVVAWPGVWLKWLGMMIFYCPGSPLRLFTVHRGPVYAGHRAVIELYCRQYQNITGIMTIIWWYHDTMPRYNTNSDNSDQEAKDKSVESSWLIVTPSPATTICKHHTLVHSLNYKSSKWSLQWFGVNFICMNFQGVSPLIFRFMLG